MLTYKSQCEDQRTCSLLFHCMLIIVSKFVTVLPSYILVPIREVRGTCCKALCYFCAFSCAAIKSYCWQQGYYWEKMGIFCQNNPVLNDSLAMELRG